MLYTVVLRITFAASHQEFIASRLHFNLFFLEPSDIILLARSWDPHSHQTSVLLLISHCFCTRTIIGRDLVPQSHFQLALLFVKEFIVYNYNSILVTTKNGNKQCKNPDGYQRAMKFSVTVLTGKGHIKTGRTVKVLAPQTAYPELNYIVKLTLETSRKRKKSTCLE